MADALSTLRNNLEDKIGRERHPDLTWPVVAYIAHMCDNLRIWAERIVGISRGGSVDVVPYDENALAAARCYDALSLPGALWSLGRSVDDWLVATDAAPRYLAMQHHERGRQGLLGVLRSNAHDVAHHVWDIRRSLAPSPER